MQLTFVQKQEWPDSKILSDERLIAALERDRGNYMVLATGKPVDWAAHVKAYRRAYPDAISYSVVEGSGKQCYGMRFGFRPEQYIGL